MRLERVCVIGSGAIGSLFAAHLAGVVDTWVLVRREEHAAALNERGLRVSGRSELVARPHATAEASELPEFDLGIVATKATHLRGAAASIAGRFPSAVLMTVQNGLGAEEIVRAHGDWRLISGTTLMGGVRKSDVHVEYELDSPTWIGPYAETETPLDLVEEVCGLLVASGLRAQAFPDLRPAVWSKLIFTSAVGGVSALTELPHVRRFAECEQLSDLGCLVHDLVEEGKRVAAAAGVELEDDPWEMNVRAVTSGSSAGGDYAHPPSILEDVFARRPTEVDFIVGAVVSEGRRAGVPTPLHTALYRLVKGKEASWG
jgi:2-dehydropantoate 2-reductase